MQSPRPIDSTIFAFVEGNESRRARGPSHGHQGSACHADTSVLRLGGKCPSRGAVCRRLVASSVPLLIHILRFLPTRGSICASVRTTNGRNGWCSIPRIRECRSPRSLSPSRMSLRTKTSPRPSSAVHSMLSQRWKRPQVTPTATNDKASAIRAKPRPPGPRMTSTAKSD